MKSFKIQSLIFLALSIAGACQVWGSDLKIQESPLYPFQSSVFLQDDFLTGTQTAGQIGALGWSSAGTISVQGSSTNSPGIYRIDTGAVLGTHARINFATSASIATTLPHSITFITRLNTNDANTTVRIGEANSVAGAPPNDGIYFEKLDADTNWFCVTRSAAVQTRTDSGIAVSTSMTKFSYTRNSSGVFFLIAGSQVCSQSTNMPSGVLSPFVYIINSAAAAKTIDVDYFQGIWTGIVR